MVNPSKKRKRKIVTLGDPDALTGGETVFNPSIPSDFTIHFNNHAFHVHSMILQNSSRYFEAAIQSAKMDASTCTQAPPCNQSAHQCLTIGDGQDKIGGMTVTVDELQRLLTQLYDPAWFCKSFPKSESQIAEWRDDLNAGGRVLYDRAGGADADPDHNAEWFIADIKSCDAEKLVLSYLIVDDSVDQASGEDNSLTEEEIHLSRNSDQLMPLGTSEIRINEDDAERFLEQHSRTIMLANYFCCISMMQMYKTRAHQLAVNAVDLQIYDHLWKLLSLSESCHWSDTTNILVKALPQDIHCIKRNGWAEAAEKVSSKSLVKVFGAMMQQ